jgi:hypothetical protein
MIYLRLFEEYNSEMTLEDILMSIVTLYDDDYTIYFFDANGKLVKADDINNSEFAFYSDNFNKRNYNFKIRIFKNDLSYDNATQIVNEMYKLINILRKQGWFLSDVHLDDSTKSTTKEITFRKVDFEFRKEIEILKKNKSIQSFFGKNLKEAQRRISNLCSDYYIDISANSVSFHDNSEIDFIQIDDYDFVSGSWKTRQDNIDAFCDRIGADSWEYRNGHNSLVFIYE